MSVDRLVLALRKEADLKEKAILAEAKEKADRILLSADKKVAKIEAEIKKVENELHSKNAYLQSSEQVLKDRRKKIWFENEYIKALKSRCKALYREFMSSGEYTDFVERELRKIQEELRDVEEIRADVITSMAFSEQIKKEVKNVYVDETLEDGFLVKASDGRINIFCNYEGRFEKVWKQVATRFVDLIAKAVENGA